MSSWFALSNRTGTIGCVCEIYKVKEVLRRQEEGGRAAGKSVARVGMPSPTFVTAAARMSLCNFFAVQCLLYAVLFARVAMEERNVEMPELFANIYRVFE